MVTSQRWQRHFWLDGFGFAPDDFGRPALRAVAGEGM
jgi:hypothetical protein